MSKKKIIDSVFLEDKFFKTRNFKGRESVAKGGGNTHRKRSDKRKTMKRRILRTRRMNRKTKLHQTYKRY